MIKKMNEMPIGPTNTRTRSILIIIVIILLVAVVIGYLSFRRAVKGGAPDTTAITAAPGIRAIPGVGKEPTREYMKLQQQKAREEVEEALRKKGAAVPSLVRTTYLGEGELALPGEAAAGCSVDELRRARKAGVSAFELRCRGCDAAALKAAGYTAGELRDAGFTAQQLKDAGFSAQDLKDAGFSAEELKAAGFTAQELKDAGFSAGELKAAGFSAEDLKAAGFSADEIAKALAKKDCSAAALSNARAQGVSAAELKECGAAALKAAGFTAQELKDAGFSAGELRAAGFSAEDLKAAGFSAQDLKDAGFSAEELKDAGFTADELKAAGFTDGDLIRAGFSADEIIPQAQVAARPTVTPGQVPSITEPKPVSALAAAPGRERSDLQDELARIREQQAKQLSQQEWQNKKQELQQNMTTQAGDLFASWTPLPRQQFVEGEQDKVAAASAAAAQAAAAGKQAVNGDILKAGTIIFAVLDTGINSDEKSPVMATITQGKLKGSKVLGEFKREDKKVLLQFKVLSIPYLDHSITFNAYGVDPEIGHIAMASSVDNHYLYRYGTLFASSFLAGLGNAVQYSGSSIIQSGDGGSVSIAYKDLNAGETALSALGEVGTKFSDVIAKDFDMPPTVRVKAGNGIGLLLMSDLTVPKG